MSAEEQLEREAAGRRLAVLGAAAAVVLQLLASFIPGSIGKDYPGPSPGQVVELPAFYHRHATTLLVSAGLSAAGYLAMALPLDYLYRAAKARRPELPSVARVLAYAGPLLLAVGTLVVQVVITVRTADYLTHHAGDYFAARQAVTTGAVYVVEAGLLALGFAFVLISINAMRVGLLTRFMGVLGAIAGVLFVLRQLLPVPPILHIFWLGAVGYLLAGRWPGGTPLAWQTGRAEPWPTAQELRERRERAQSAREEPAREPEPPGDPARPRPRSRKRKRRR